jgi:hypothetical protein
MPHDERRWRDLFSLPARLAVPISRFVASRRNAAHEVENDRVGRALFCPKKPQTNSGTGDPDRSDQGQPPATQMPNAGAPRHLRADLRLRIFGMWDDTFHPKRIYPNAGKNARKK